MHASKNSPLVWLLAWSCSFPAPLSHPGASLPTRGSLMHHRSFCSPSPHSLSQITTRTTTKKSHGGVLSFFHPLAHPTFPLELMRSLSRRSPPFLSLSHPRICAEMKEMDEG